jgi:hypothetical protein
VIEAENRRRVAAAAVRGLVPSLVTMVNDCCLAFCVLVMNGGSEGGGGQAQGQPKGKAAAPKSASKRKAGAAAAASSTSSSSSLSSGGSLRLLDLAEEGLFVTPCVVTQDAHKHLGTDKGVSTVKQETAHNSRTQLV